MSAKVPRVIVLTSAKKNEVPVSFLTDRERFPLEQPLTTDLAKARRWLYPPGVRRFLERNKAFTGFRRVYIPYDQIEAAATADAKAAEPVPLPPVAAGASGSSARPRHSHHGRTATARTTKLDPNKRAKAARRKRAFRSLRQKLNKPKLRTMAKRRKVA